MTELERLKIENAERKQITLRIPERVYEALVTEAEEKGIPVNELILLRINPLKADFSTIFSHVLSQNQ